MNEQYIHSLSPNGTLELHNEVRFMFLSWFTVNSIHSGDPSRDFDEDAVREIVRYSTKDLRRVTTRYASIHYASSESLCWEMEWEKYGKISYTLRGRFLVMHLTDDPKDDYKVHLYGQDLFNLLTTCFD